MKNVKTIIIAAILSIGAANVVYAQNLQVFYDTGRGCVTSTVEMFRPDGGGSTFFFVDFDYSPNAVGAARNRIHLYHRTTILGKLKQNQRMG